MSARVGSAHKRRRGWRYAGKRYGWVSTRMYRSLKKRHPRRKSRRLHRGGYTYTEHVPKTRKSRRRKRPSGGYYKKRRRKGKVSRHTKRWHSKMSAQRAYDKENFIIEQIRDGYSRAKAEEHYENYLRTI